MIRRRITAALASFGLAASLLASAAAAPAVTLASTPSWEPMVVVALPGTVTYGAVAGYQISITNDGPSNISQLYLFATDASGNLDVTPPVYENPFQGTCNDPSTGFYCSLGQLNAHATVTVIVAYTTPTSGASVTHYFSANTTGSTANDGGTSHGDTNDGQATTNLVGAASDSGGAFVTTNGQTIQNNQTIGAGNRQSTKALLNGKFYPATVQDGATFSPTDLQACTLSTKTFNCTDLFGEWSQVNVNNGAVFSSYFTITVQIDATLVGSGVNANNLVVYHQYQDSAGVWHQEAIIASCSGSAVPCRSVTTGKVYWTISIRTYHNGNFRLG